VKKVCVFGHLYNNSTFSAVVFLNDQILSQTPLWYGQLSHHTHEVYPAAYVDEESATGRGATPGLKILDEGRSVRTIEVPRPSSLKGPRVVKPH
jgi:hypothetical protein